ncbi:hypothetical protein ACM66B_000041 [Microbotryomycetes sp. NB124-2]
MSYDTASSPVGAERRENDGVRAIEQGPRQQQQSRATPATPTTRQSEGRSLQSQLSAASPTKRSPWNSHAVPPIVAPRSKPTSPSKTESAGQSARIGDQKEQLGAVDGAASSGQSPVKTTPASPSSLEQQATTSVVASSGTAQDNNKAVQDGSAAESAPLPTMTSCSSPGKPSQEIRKQEDERQKKGQTLLGEFGITATLPPTRPMSPPLPGSDSNSANWTPDPRCSDEQKEVLEAVKAGKNVFFTGPAGVGKSFLLEEVKRLLQFMDRDFWITAPTGIAAINVGGTTLHSFLGVGLAKASLSNIFSRIRNSTRDRNERDELGLPKKFTKLHTLIIDEISMVDPMFFTIVNMICKMFRRNTNAFGGIQIIVCGDFFQLPPVIKTYDLCCPHCESSQWRDVRLANSQLPFRKFSSNTVHDVLKCAGKYGPKKSESPCTFETRKYEYVFETDTWHECDFVHKELSKVFRQEDGDFIRLLEEIRRGHCSAEAVKFISNCGIGFKSLGKIKPTELHTRNRDADITNANEFNKLPGESVVYDCFDDLDGPQLDRMSHMQKTDMMKCLKDCQAPVELPLKLGAQVILLSNLDLKRGLANGSRGVVVDFVESSEVADTLANDIDMARRDGRTNGEIRRMKGDKAFSANVAKLPVVYFASGTTVVVPPHTWEVTVNRNYMAMRTQLPLKHAWALTIHKSQGQSLDAVVVSLPSTFQVGQAYVALSRCRTPEGMTVKHGVSADKVRASPLVKQFYNCIKQGKRYISSRVDPVNPRDWIRPDQWELLDKQDLMDFPEPKVYPRGGAVLPPGGKIPAEFDPNVPNMPVAPFRQSEPPEPSSSQSDIMIVDPPQLAPPLAGHFRPAFGPAATTAAAPPAQRAPFSYAPATAMWAVLLEQAFDLAIANNVPIGDFQLKVDSLKRVHEYHQGPRRGTAPVEQLILPSSDIEDDDEDEEDKEAEEVEQQRQSSPAKKPRLELAPSQPEQGVSPVDRLGQNPPLQRSSTSTTSGSSTATSETDQEGSASTPRAGPRATSSIVSSSDVDEPMPTVTAATHNTPKKQSRKRKKRLGA